MFWIGFICGFIAAFIMLLVVFIYWVFYPFSH